MNVHPGTIDQAETLRLMASNYFRHQNTVPELPKSGIGTGVRVISVTSGKGGVGKSNVVVNLAVALANEGKRVLIIDADLGLGNIDVLLGLKPTHTLNDVFNGNMHLTDIMVEGPSGIRIIPAGSGVQKFTALDREARLRLMDELESLEDDFDILLIDTESGISENVTYFNVAAQEILLIVSPDPTSIADVYALTKLLATRFEEKHFKVLVNMARDTRDGFQVFKRLSSVVNRFLDVSLDYVGCVVHDERLGEAVRRQKSVIELYPLASSSHCFTSLARNFVVRPGASRLKGNIQFLFRRYFELAPVMRYV
jgi:flagellar biosynthesis protein FlhG